MPNNNLIGRNATEKMKYWRAMAYGSVPSVAIRDSDTLEAFDETSKWAESDEDDPIAVSSGQSSEAVAESTPVLGMNHNNSINFETKT